MIKSGKLKKESWKIRCKVIDEIIDGEYYDYYGVSNPIQDLFKALLFNDKEKIEAADMTFASGSEYVKKDGAHNFLDTNCER